LHSRTPWPSWPGDVTRVAKRFAHVWKGVSWHALAVNVVFRLLIVAFTVDALINAGR
jgi:hypothetical protein